MRVSLSRLVPAWVPVALICGSFGFYTDAASASARVARYVVTVSDTTRDFVARLTSLLSFIDQEVWTALKAFSAYYLQHREQVVQAARASDFVRHNWYFGIGAFVVYALITLPRDGGAIVGFFNQMMKKAPLPAYRKGGVTDIDIEKTRKVLFFYCLYLLYQVIQFPLTVGQDNQITFYADAAIQVILLGALFGSFGDLKLNFLDAWKGEADLDRKAKAQKMKNWLDTKLSGMNVRWRDMRGYALSVFAVNFLPWALFHAPGALDGMARVTQSYR